jgi:phospholipid/cholesterol/gamma-HCH transport system substrate-binding protein
MVFAVLVIIWLGMSRVFETGLFYVTYFDESVQGLNIDSPVKYRGVFIGRVESIDVAPDSKLIQIVIKVESGQTFDRNIVAQLKSVGITGSMFVELDRKKVAEPDQSPKINFPSEYPIIPSKPSEIGALISGINQVLDQIKSLDLQGLNEQVKLTLANINHKVSQANVKQISDSFEASLVRVNYLLDSQRWNQILESADQGVRSFNTLVSHADGSLGRVDQTIARVSGIVIENKKTIEAALDEFNRAMQNANDLLKKGSVLVGGTDESISNLLNHLLIVAHNLEKASENLNEITELLADQPSQLIFGDPPVSRKFESETGSR